MILMGKRRIMWIVLYRAFGINNVLFGMQARDRRKYHDDVTVIIDIDKGG